MKELKVTQDFIKRIPDDAEVFYNDRVNPDNSFHSFWKDQVCIEGFADQFIGAKVRVEIADGEGDDYDLRQFASNKKVYSFFLEEGERFSDGCTAERMEVAWSE